MFEDVNIKVSKQKIYDSLLIIKMKYKTFHNLCIYVSYTPYQGLKLNVKPDAYVRRTCWMKDTLEVTDCLSKKTIFEIAEAIGTETELWIKQNKFKYDRVPDVYSDYITLH